MNSSSEEENKMDENQIVPGDNNLNFSDTKTPITFPKFEDQKNARGPTSVRLYVRRSLVIWLRALFNQIPWIKTPDPENTENKGYQWLEDQKQTKVWISYEYPQQEFRSPQIVIRAGGLNYDPTGLGQWAVNEYNTQMQVRIPINIGVRTYNLVETQVIADAIWYFVTERGFSDLLMSTKQILIDAGNTKPRIIGTTAVPVGEGARFEDIITFEVLTSMQFNRPEPFITHYVKEISVTMEAIDTITE